MRSMMLALSTTVLLSQPAAAQTTPWADKLFGGTITHDFGMVPRGQQLTNTFKLTNIYKESLEITAIRVGCSCLTAKANASALQPNESTTLEVHMDARRFSGPKTVHVFVTVGPKYVS